MNESRIEKIAKWAVLLGVIPIVLAIIYSRESGQAVGNVKPVSTRKQMADFSLRNLAGTDWRLSAHRGNVVLVNFWATWCGPCREETPGLVRVAHTYAPKGLAVAGITMDDGGMEPVRRFIRDYGVDYPILIPGSDFDLAGRIGGLPTTLLIDRQGRVAKTYVGRVREVVFRADVELLLNEPGTEPTPATK
jgi:cytochrome c biogenesis protein CcmG/thiol:disulfide interchange protein DsbE